MKMAQINRLVGLLLCTVFILSCTDNNNLYDYLERHRQQYAEKAGDINLEDFFGIEFDRFYIIGESNDHETIGKLLRIPYENKAVVADSMNRLIFIKNDTVAYEIDIDGHEIYFEQEDKAKALYCSIFKVEPEGERSFLLVNL